MKRFFQGCLGISLLFFTPMLWAAININSADVTALDALPGIGPAKAQAIVEYREQHGSFRSVEELGSVHGIGSKLLERLRPSLALEGASSLPAKNTGSAAVNKASRRKAVVPAGEERAIRHGSHGYILDSGSPSNAFTYRHFSVQEHS